MLALFGLLAVLVALAATPTGGQWWDVIAAAATDLWHLVRSWAQGWFG
jgi:hypothetical protein